MAAMVVLALFVAQAINFGFALHDRQAFRLEQIVGPVSARIVDTTQNLRPRDPVIEARLSAVRSGETPWDRFRSGPLSRNPMPAGLSRRSDIENGIRHKLAEAGVATGQVIAAIRPISPDDPRLDRLSRYRAQRLRMTGTEMLIAVEQPGVGWWAQGVPWDDSDWPMLRGLIGQTLVLYAIVLLPVLWATRRIARPLRTLTRAAERFHPADGQGPIEESGPHDVRTLIAAFNRLRTRVMAMLDEKDRMLGAIGHDLRTPLAALRVRIESVEDDDDRIKMADTIDEMNGTLDDILSLARLGRPSEALTEVDVAALVDAVVEDFRDLGKPVTYREAERLPMRLRPSLIRRSVRNLIENAVKYGGSADVSLTATAHAVRITVADNGPGIP
ncbi:MAG: HAMP domain-containing histidine kinase, partial [Proteobacteria bacterium]|nr:HAMP domain-containing histidine kinase [Pseudomonadota bacterium]